MSKDSVIDRSFDGLIAINNNRPHGDVTYRITVFDDTTENEVESIVCSSIFSALMNLDIQDKRLLSGQSMTMTVQSAYAPVTLYFREIE